MQQWVFPAVQQQIIYFDYFVHAMCKMLLFVVDGHRKWSEAFIVPNTYF